MPETVKRDTLFPRTRLRSEQPFRGYRAFGPVRGGQITIDTLTFVGTATTVLRLGSFTLLTDPNFLHRGQRAYLGKGLWSRRLTDPALEPEQLPVLDAVVLSHLHGDHFDRVARRRLDRSPPVITTPKAARRLDSWGFETRGLSTWTNETLVHGEETLTVTALPGIHARGVVRPLLPPVMGSMLELVRPAQPTLRVYVSGDTLTGDHVSEIATRYPDIDVAVVHLGGTRVLFHTVTMDAAQGVDFLQRARPATAIPVHYDDYRVFRDPLDAFVRRAREAGLAQVVQLVERGSTVSLQRQDDSR
jgi:L-ascorbate metabolism protein UlaG (beta-lactamase superfamily)